MTTTSTSSNAEENFSIKMSLKHLRIAVIGNVDAGKSTLIGTLKTGILDNGRGQSRVLVTKHQHEIDSGRTSTVTMHMVGYNVDGEPVKSTVVPRTKNEFSR